MSRHDVHRDAMFDEDPKTAAFARDLRAAATVTPAPAVGASLAAVLEGRAPAAVYPDAVLAPRARVARRHARLRWALAAAAAMVGTSSLSAAGALPDPVQRQISRMADVIGIDVPDGDDDADPTTTTRTPNTTSTTIATTTSTAPPVGTTVLTDGQDAGGEKPDRERGDQGGRGRGSGGVDGEHDGEPGDGARRSGVGVDRREDIEKGGRLRSEDEESGKQE